MFSRLGLGSDVFLLALIAASLFFMCFQIEKKTNIPGPILYLLIGIPLGVNFLDVLNKDVFPSIGFYQTYLLWLMFFGAGFGLNFKTLKESGSKVVKLSTIPVFGEVLIMSLIGYFILNGLLPFNLKFTDTLLIVTLFAMASPANIIPLTSKHLQEGRTGNDDSGKTIIMTSILDNFIPMPFLVVIAAIVAGPSFGWGTEVSVITLKALLSTVFYVVLSFSLGYLLGFILKPLALGVKEKDCNPSYVGYTLLGFIFVFILFLVLATLPLTKDNILFFIVAVATFVGAGLINNDPAGIHQRVGMTALVIFNVIGLPIVFMSISASIDFSILANFSYVSGVLVFVLMSVLVKSVFAFIACRGTGFDSNDMKYIYSAFIPKGKTLTNFALIMAAILGATSDVVAAMSLLAVLGMLFTMPLGIALMSIGGKKWLK